MAETQQDGQRSGHQGDSGAPAKKRTVGKPFTGGDDPRLRQNLAAARAALPAVEEAAPEGVPQQLLDMRHVVERPPREDRTQGQRTCRKWLKADLPGFMAKKTVLEAKVLPSRPPARGSLADFLGELGEDVTVRQRVEVDGFHLTLYLSEEKYGEAREGFHVLAGPWKVEGGDGPALAMDIPEEELADFKEEGEPGGLDDLADCLRRAVGRLKARSAYGPRPAAPPPPSRVFKPCCCLDCARLNGGPRRGCPACAAIQAEREAERAVPAPEYPRLCERCEKIGPPSCPACKTAFYG